jgi:hypothetical protein
VVDGLDDDVVDHLDVVAAQFLAQQPAQLDVDGGHDRRGLLDHGNLQAAGGEGLGHLQADVATPDDDGRAGAGGQRLVEGEGVGHGMQHVHPGQVQAVDRGADRDGAGPDDELVIAQLALAVLAGDGDLLSGGVDRAGGVIQQELEAGLFQVGGGAVGQIPPVTDVAGQVVGQPADGEVGEGVGHDHGGLGRGVEFAGPQGGRDAGVAAPDHQQPHPDLLRSAPLLGQAPAGTRSSRSCWTRLSMSSRMRRTTSTGWPAGSWSSQSS